MIKLALAAALLAACATAQAYGPYDAELIRVIDGDTAVMKIHIWPDHAVTMPVRFLGVDTPEKRSNSRRRVPQCEKDLAAGATLFTRAALLGVNPELLKIDKVKHGRNGGRIVGRVLVNGVDIAEMLIHNGHGRKQIGGAWCG